MNTLDAYIAEYGVYLEDLKKRILFILKLYIGIFSLGFFMTGFIVKTLIKLLDFKNVSIVITSPFQMVDIAMSTGFFVASVVMAPVVVYQIYTFLSPGLLPKEKRLFIFLIPVALLLFFVGFAYGFLTLYFGISFIAQVNIQLGVVNYWDIGKFISDIVFTSSLLGIIFQFPIVITFLVQLGIIDSFFLRKKRRIAYFLIFVFVSLLPPTDGLSLILMVVPMVLIYELTVLANSKYVHKNKLIQ